MPEATVNFKKSKHKDAVEYTLSKHKDAVEYTLNNNYAMQIDKVN